MQPSLLRVLEQREVRRVGSNQTVPVDVRVVAATNRDLREEVTRGRFREDLYYRIAVFHVRIPPLRERAQDVLGLARVLLWRMGQDAEAIERVLTPELCSSMPQGRWPGNVRELRNYLRRCVVLGEPTPIHAAAAPSSAVIDASVPYAEARAAALARFEKTYATELLARHGNNVSAAARASEMARPYLHRLLRKHGLR